MSDTPRTDAVIARDTGDSGLIAELASESRKLERELAEARQQIGSLLGVRDERDEWRLLAEQAEGLVHGRFIDWHSDHERLLKLYPVWK